MSLRQLFWAMLGASLLVAACAQGSQDVGDDDDDDNNNGGGSSSACDGASDGLPCGDSTQTDCDAPDICFAGACAPSFEVAGFPCGDQTATECSEADSCDGQGNCAASDLPAGTVCGDSSDEACDAADSCDGSGSCDDNLAAADSACGDASDSDCQNPDRCDSSGSCLADDEADGTVCDDCPAGAGQCSVCDAGQCLDACSPTPYSLLTTFAGGNGLDGNMFDVVAINDVTIVSVEANLNAGSHTVEIYYKVGSYVGSETSPSAWTLAGSASGVTSNGEDTATPVPATLNVAIAGGQTYGFYVTSASAGMSYTDGSSVGTIAAQDANVQILEGAGNVYPFGSFFVTSRIWNGILHYETDCN